MHSQAITYPNKECIPRDLGKKGQLTYVRIPKSSIMYHRRTYVQQGHHERVPS